MERENSLGLLPDLEKLSLEKGRALDVEDLDDAGWKAASRENKIVEIGRLGEGAGGAVTQCVLKGGKTVFALKVSCFARVILLCLCVTGYHDEPGSGCPEANRARTLFQQELPIRLHMPILWRLS
jgi:hypothetical protein